MGLLCRTKVWIYSQMNLEFGALEPTATAFHQVGRLAYLGQAEDVAIKFASAVLSAYGHGKLNMIDVCYEHVMIFAPRAGSEKQWPLVGSSRGPVDRPLLGRSATLIARVAGSALSV